MQSGWYSGSNWPHIYFKNCPFNQSFITFLKQRGDTLVRNYHEQPSFYNYMLSNRRPVKDLRPAASSMTRLPSNSWIVQVWGRACQRLMPLLCGLSRSDSPIPIHQWYRGWGRGDPQSSANEALYLCKHPSILGSMDWSPVCASRRIWAVDFCSCSSRCRVWISPAFFFNFQGWMS